MLDPDVGRRTSGDCVGSCVQRCMRRVCEKSLVTLLCIVLTLPVAVAVLAAVAAAVAVAAVAALGGRLLLAVCLQWPSWRNFAVVLVFSLERRKRAQILYISKISTTSTV